MGKQDEAASVLRSYLKGDPMDYVAMYILNEIESNEELSSLIYNRKENVYHVLAFFDEVGDWDRCLAVIDSYVEHGEIPNSLQRTGTTMPILWTAAIATTLSMPSTK